MATKSGDSDDMWRQAIRTLHNLEFDGEDKLFSGRYSIWRSNQLWSSVIEKIDLKWTREGVRILNHKCGLTLYPTCKGGEANIFLVT